MWAVCGIVASACVAVFYLAWLTSNKRNPIHDDVGLDIFNGR